MKKILSFLLILVLIAACGGGIYYFVEMRDTTPPAIIVNKPQGALYHAGITTSELLDGVVAIDDKSGNVSGTLMVASVSQGAAPGTADVIFSAQDKAGHVTQYLYEMQTDGSAVESFINTSGVPDASAAQNNGAAQTEANGTQPGSDGVQAGADSAQPASDGTQTNADAAAVQANGGSAQAAAQTSGEWAAAMPLNGTAQTGDAAVQTADTAQTAQTAQTVQTQPVAAADPSDPAAYNEYLKQTREAMLVDMPAVSPKVYLSKYYEEIVHGTQMDQMYYVSNIVDDVDSMDSLLPKVQVYGEVDVNVPGTYDLNYYVMDSEGHQSNMATLTVRVY